MYVLYTSTYVRIYVCIHVYMYECMYVFMHHMYICMHGCIYAYKYGQHISTTSAYLSKVELGWSDDGGGISRIELSRGRLTSTRAPLMEKEESMRCTNLAAATNPPSRILIIKDTYITYHTYIHAVLYKLAKAPDV